MTTNVRPGDLNYHNYDSQKYDTDIVRSIPGYLELHLKIDAIVREKYVGRTAKILELGVGTGLTAERILNVLPNAEYTAVDFSEQMLAGARKRLSSYNVRFIKGDYSQIKLPNNNDLIVSVINVHHQKTEQDKKNIFRRIYKSLCSGGIFIFGDLVTYRNPREAALNDARHFHYLVEYAQDEDSLKDWAHHHKFLNRLSPLEDQVDWLYRVGFGSVEILFQQCNTALLVAGKF